MKMVLKIAATILGAIAILLGGLWLLQGLGIVVIEPILCVAECEAVAGPNATWAIAGAALLVVGVAAVFFALRRRQEPHRTGN